MAEKHREVTFEQELVASLLSHGWQEGDPKRYDRALALYPDDLIGWLQAMQPQEWAKLAAFYHGDPTQHLLEYVGKLLDKEGALALLRRGFKDGNARFQLCQFKPSHGFNPQLQALCDQVRLRVVRQVHYSLHNENSIDVVLFANGIPVATLEHKTVNKDEEILAAFAPYYRTAELAGVSDPNIIHALQNKLDGERIYTEAEVDAFCQAYFDPKCTQKLLQARIAPAVDHFRVRLRAAEASGDKAELDALGIFRKDIGSFVRAYEFLAQIFDYGDTDLEKRAVFYRHLQPWLKVENTRTPIDLSAVDLAGYRLQDLGQRAIKLEEERAEYKLPPLGEVGTASAQDPQLAPLAEIVRQVNELFAGDVREVDMLAVAHHVSGRMLQNPDLAQQAASNSKEQFAMGDYPKVFMDTLVDALDGYQGVVEQVLAQEGIGAGFERLVLELVYKGFAEKRNGQTGQDAET